MQLMSLRIFGYAATAISRFAETSRNTTWHAWPVGHIRALLAASGHAVSEQEAYLAVENFFEWFHDDIFIYHSSYIAEFLNNIRWAIFDYLRPEFARSWHLTERATPDFPIYAYRYPDGCTEPVARAMYWDVMNCVRGRPWMHRFIVSDSFKQRY